MQIIVVGRQVNKHPQLLQYLAVTAKHLTFVNDYDALTALPFHLDKRLFQDHEIL